MSGAAEPTQEVTGIFDVWEHDIDDEADEEMIGRVEYHADGRLAILEAVPERHEFLQTAVDRVNGKETLTRMVGAGPDAPQFAVGSETIGRDSTEFPRILQEHLSKYFGLRLA